MGVTELPPIIFHSLSQTLVKALILSRNRDILSQDATIEVLNLFFDLFEVPGSLL